MSIFARTVLFLTPVLDVQLKTGQKYSFEKTDEMSRMGVENRAVLAQKKSHMGTLFC